MSCCICLEDVELEKMGPCKHLLHRDCIVKMLNNLCPLCRTPLDKKIKHQLITGQHVEDNDEGPWFRTRVIPFYYDNNSGMAIPRASIQYTNSVVLLGDISLLQHT